MLQTLRLVFGLMLCFGALNLSRGSASGPYTRAFDLTLFIGGSIGSLVMWAFGWGKFEGGGAKLACPECGTMPPLVRKPANRRQMIWGGWTCKECGCECDRRGRKVPDAKS